MVVFKKFTFDSAHRLLDYDGLCGNLHGHTWIVELGYSGELQITGNDKGMIVDFNEIKKWSELVKQKFDHVVILEKKDHLVEVMIKNGQKTFVMEDRPTVENMAKEILKIAKCDFIKIWETPTSYVELSK